jgi:hypothetical protein
MAIRLPLKSSAVLISGRTISLSGMKLIPPATIVMSAPRKLALTAKEPVEKRNCDSLATRVCMPTVPFSMAMYSMSMPYFFKSF